MRIWPIVPALVAAAIGGAACEDKQPAKPPSSATSTVPPPPVQPPPVVESDAAPSPERDGGVDMQLGAPRICVEPQSRQGLCACLFDSLDASSEFGFDDEHDDDYDSPEPTPRCKAIGEPVADVSLWRVYDARRKTDDSPHGYFLVTKVDDAFASIGAIRSDLGRSRHTLATYKPGGLERREAGPDRAYLWVEGRELDADFDGGVSTEVDARQVTLCPLPASPETGCPLQVPVRTKTTVTLEWDEPDVAAEFRDTWGKDSPVEIVVALRVDVRIDGIVAISVARGEVTDSIEPYVGEHRIW